MQGYVFTLSPFAMLLGAMAALLFGAVPGAQGAADSLIEALDLSRPDMAAVKAAYDRGDDAGARAAFAAHLRSRTSPRWYFDPSAPPAALSSEDRETADLALKHTLSSVWIPHTFGPIIDWAYNPTTQPGSSWPPDNEWTWQLNRHPFWGSLARAYNATKDPKYARELVSEILGWISANPAPEKVQNGPYSRWRTIEAGIRMSGVWPEVFYRMVRLPDAFPDDVLLAMVDSMRQHADYLDKYPTGGNWLTMEADGEYHVGVLFPEFRNARHWRETAIGRLRREIDAQVYPDGVQKELSPNYHYAALINFVMALRIARLNNVPLPDGYQSGLERMFCVYQWAMAPDGDIPHVNDSWTMDVPRLLADGLSLFPQHDDWRWIATGGKEGREPKETSHLFPWAGWAGWAVMRSGWDRDAGYLFFDGGPFGAGHQHEDKLSFVLHACGADLIDEARTSKYDASPMRHYVLTSRAHNVVLIDGKEQHRRQHRETFVAEEPYPFTWITTPGYDYAAASYGKLPGETWGDNDESLAVHTRRILYVKRSGYFILCDTITPNDEQEHTIETVFHLAPPTAIVQEGSATVTSGGDGSASISIIPLRSEGLSVRIVTGQTEPAFDGWMSPKEREKPDLPRPVVHYVRKGEGTLYNLYVLAPAAAGKPAPVTSVLPASVPGCSLAAEIHLSSGGTALLMLNGDGSVSLKANGKEWRSPADS